ncbi:hypothetical protein GUJ93_ZPchr0013g34206 [Zizania palustris]|uniref:F-box domain-containing protein n=1 Tax=Zizania palustris TaxID=103762 RepID=A0A8J6C5H8_ZIZPA|nr:hypothetical protein GUJ93_ZPchr0013g34206 [Zizania palustris]
MSTPNAIAAAEDTDLIGCPPDCLLSTILSLLPLDAAARTSVLSHQWRHLWPSTLLRLIDSNLPSPFWYHSTVISRILTFHRGNAISFHISLNRPSSADLDSWLRILTAKCLQELC